MRSCSSGQRQCLPTVCQCVIYGTVRTEEMVCLHGRPASDLEVRVVFSGRVRGHRHLLVQQRERILDQNLLELAGSEEVVRWSFRL